MDSLKAKGTSHITLTPVDNKSHFVVNRGSKLFRGLRIFYDMRSKYYSAIKFETLFIKPIRTSHLALFPINDFSYISS